MGALFSNLVVEAAGLRERQDQAWYLLRLAASKAGKSCWWTSKVIPTWGSRAFLSSSIMLKSCDGHLIPSYEESDTGKRTRSG